MDASKRIERDYFEIKKKNVEQWEKPQIIESNSSVQLSLKVCDKVESERMLLLKCNMLLDWRQRNHVGSNIIKKAPCSSLYISEEYKDIRRLEVLFIEQPMFQSCCFILNKKVEINKKLEIT